MPIKFPVMRFDSLVLWSFLCAPFILEASLVQFLSSADPSDVTTNDSAEVIAWSDLSGNSNQAVAKVGSATFPASARFTGNRVGVDFGPTSVSLELLDAAKTAAVLDFNGSAAGNTGFAIMVAVQVETLKTDDWNDVIGVTSSFTNGGFSMRFSQGGVIQVNFGGSSFKRPTSDVSVTSGDSLVLIVNYDSSTGEVQLWDSLNQSTIAWNQPAGDFSIGGDGTLRLGELGWGSRFLIGSVGEVQVFDSKLSQVKFGNVVSEASATWIVEAGPAPLQHLDASDAGSVIGNPMTQWNDRSGNGRNAVLATGNTQYPSASLFSSQRAGVDFGQERNILQLMSASEAEDFLDFSGSASGNTGFSVLISARVDTLRTNDWNDLIGTTSNGTAGGFGLRYSRGGVIQVHMGGVPFTRPGSDRRVKSGVSIVFALNYDAESGTATLWDSLNGSEISWTVASGDFVDTDLNLGGNAFATRFFDGVVGELKLYNRKLTAAEFESQRTAMTLKWVGIAPPIPEVPRKPSWTIDQLLEWDPTADPDAPFNVGSVLLQDRFEVPAALKANGNAKSGQGGIQALETFRGEFPQGGDGGENIFAFTYWQYLEESVYWGGIGAINFVPPTGEMIDNAHRNGVPILGTVFFPPLVFGGNYEWVQTFLQKDGASFPAADKLIETAEYYGFDGWFINQETEGGDPADAAAMRDLIRYIRENSDIIIRWYDSMREDGVIAWQDYLSPQNDWYLRHNYSTNTQNPSGALIADGIFIDFIDFFDSADPTFLSDLTRSNALSLGLDPYDIFTGQEAQANNFKTSTSPRLRMSNVFPDGQDHITSLGFYQTLKYATEIPDQDLFWTGASGDPRDTSTTVETGNWQGVAHNIAARSVINSLPFGTDFNIGKGDKYYVDGKMVREGAWYNRALQAILPTWRWIVDSTGTKLTPELWTGDSYQGGSSLRVSGNLDAPNTVRLYLTDLPVTADTRLKIVYKRDGVAEVDSHMEVGVSLANQPTSSVFYDAGDCKVDGWNETVIDLGDHAGSVMRALSLKFAAPAAIPDYQILIGKISVFNDTESGPEAPSNIQEIDIANWAGLITGRVKWDHAPGEVYAYDVYIRTTDGSLTFAGSTPSNYFYFDDLPLPAEYEEILVQSTSPDMRKSLFSNQPMPNIQASSARDAVGGDTIQLAWPTLPGAAFESKPSLSPAAQWQRVIGVMIDEKNGTSSVEIPIGPEKSRFFRLRW